MRDVYGNNNYQQYVTIASGADRRYEFTHIKQGNLVALSVVMLLVWFSGRFEELSKHAYRDVFLSFTLPYIMGAAWYYISLIYEARRANTILDQVNKRENNERHNRRMRKKI